MQHHLLDLNLETKNLDIRRIFSVPFDLEIELNFFSNTFLRKTEIVANK